MSRSKAAFREIVSQAMDLVPAEFRPWLDNLEIGVEDWPDPGDLAALGIPEDEDLYGLYLGTPLPERSLGMTLLPDRILIYRGPLEEDFPDVRDLRREVAVTLLHEIAHHLGIPESRLEELGLD